MKTLTQHITEGILDKYANDLKSLKDQYPKALIIDVSKAIYNKSMNLFEISDKKVKGFKDDMMDIILHNPKTNNAFVANKRGGITDKNIQHSLGVRYILKGDDNIPYDKKHAIHVLYEKPKKLSEKQKWANGKYGS